MGGGHPPKEVRHHQVASGASHPESVPAQRGVAEPCPRACGAAIRSYFRFSRSGRMRWTTAASLEHRSTLADVGRSVCIKTVHFERCYLRRVHHAVHCVTNVFLSEVRRAGAQQPRFRFKLHVLLYVRCMRLSFRCCDLTPAPSRFSPEWPGLLRHIDAVCRSRDDLLCRALPPVAPHKPWPTTSGAIVGLTFLWRRWCLPCRT